MPRCPATGRSLGFCLRFNAVTTICFVSDPISPSLLVYSLLLHPDLALAQDPAIVIIPIFTFTFFLLFMVSSDPNQRLICSY